MELNNTFPNLFHISKESNETSNDITPQYNLSAIFNISNKNIVNYENQPKAIKTDIKKNTTIDIIEDADEQFSCENSLLITEEIQNEDKRNL